MRSLGCLAMDRYKGTRKLFGLIVAKYNTPQIVVWRLRHVSIMWLSSLLDSCVKQHILLLHLSFGRRVEQRVPSA